MLEPIIHADFWKSSSLIKHGFFNRVGGVSKNGYESLNVKSGIGDTDQNVLENRRRILNVFGGDDIHLSLVQQVHGNVCALAGENNDMEADAIVTDQLNTVLAVYTADCVPILFSAVTQKPVIGVAHAGWKGALSGVIENTLLKMEELGAERKNISACIGPCIGQYSYEVSEEFYRNFLDVDALSMHNFKKSIRSGHYLFDLQGFCQRQLTLNDVGSVYCCNIDTYSDPERWFSHRYAMHHGNPSTCGRQLSGVMLSEHGSDSITG